MQSERAILSMASCVLAEKGTHNQLCKGQPIWVVGEEEPLEQVPLHTQFFPGPFRRLPANPRGDIFLGPVPLQPLLV